MTDAKKIPWCSIDPAFPERAYLTVVMFAEKNGSLAAIYALERIVTTPEDAVSYAAKTIPELEKGNPEYMAMQTLSVFPISLSSRYPLRREFWESPDVRFSPQTRTGQFAKISKFPEAYDILVTPWELSKKQPSYLAAMALLRSTGEGVIEQFMLHSDWPVDPLAKFAAVYHMHPPEFYNWMTGKKAA